MDADTEFNPDLLRNVGVLRGHGALNIDRATDGIDGAGKFHEHAVTRRLDDATTVRSYGGVNSCLSGCFEPRQGAFFVGAHQTTIAGHIRSQHRR
jgi:hypothetical protein